MDSNKSPARINMNRKNSTPSAPTDGGETRRERKERRAHVRLVIETYEWMIHNYARARREDECRELAERMMARAKENPEDFGRWKRVTVEVL